MRNCGTRTFDNIDKPRIDAILRGLADHGSLVTGTNPWDVDTKDHGVRLRGEWDQEASKLTITVTDADWYVTRNKIWKNLESLLRVVQEAPG